MKKAKREGFLSKSMEIVHWYNYTHTKRLHYLGNKTRATIQVWEIALQDNKYKKVILSAAAIKYTK
jgi:hypothetical protein